MDNCISYDIAGAVKASGLSRSRIYVLIGQGLLDARKASKRTIVTGESLRRYVANLPAASIRAPKAA